MNGNRRNRLFSTSGTGVDAGFAFGRREILVLATLLGTFLVQLMIWPIVRPYSWFLFIPAVFLSAWIGGRRLGILASILATLLIWYFFLPPERSFLFAQRPAGAIAAALVFLGMGVVFSVFHDRLKRAERRAAEALAAGRYQAQLESVFQTIGDGIVVTDMKGNFLMVNEAAARINGFPSVEVMRQNLPYYRQLYELHHPDGKPLPFEEWPINKVINGESITNLEFRARRRDTGQEWSFSLSGEPVRDDRGEQILAVLAIRDITEQKRAEQWLRASENRFRAIFENAAVGIARVAPDGRFLEVNLRLCDIVGYAREELLAKSFGDITYPDDLETNWAQARQLLAGEISTCSIEKRYCRKNGSIVWANVTVALVRKDDGSPDYFISVIEDISARKEAEEKLRDSEERLRLALRAAGLGVFEWNVQADRAVWENDRMYEIFGHTLADGTLSKERLTANYICPDDIAGFEQALADGMKYGRPVHTIYRIRRKDGALRWLDLSSNFELSPTGAPIRMIGVLTDITERREAEEKLRASEEQFRILADTAPVLIWMSGTDKLCTFFNKPWLNFTGRTMEQELGNGWTAGVHPDDYNRCLEIYDTSFEARDPFQMEYRLRRYDGEYRWIVDKGVPRFSPNGDFLGYIGSCLDITEQKAIEQALRASELRFRTMISAIPSLTYEGDAEGNNIFASDRWCAYTGLTAEETAGKGFLKALHPDDVEENKLRYEAAVRSGTQFESRLRLRAAEGSYRWFLNRALPGHDAEGRITRWAGSLTDIEDLVRVEQELRESKERLAGIVSTAMDAIITVDEDHRVVLFNEAAEKMFGCPAAEAIDQTIDRFIPALLRNGHAEQIRRFGGTSGPGHAIGRLNLLTALRADGTEFPIEAAISSIEVGGRKLLTVIHRDITERKQAEAERAQLAHEQAARAAAEAANRSKDEFLAMVSHELRSPLSAILGYTRMLRYGPADTEAITKMTAVVERNAKAQLQIIEDLLDSARIITGKLRIQLEPVDLVLVLEAALDTARPAAEAKGVQLAADFGPAPEQTLGDSTRLQQMVWNLLTNAVKFTPRGGRVTLRMEGAHDSIRIIISDNGTGIEPGFLPFLFDRFRQADSSSARRFGGLGLGLSLVKHLVELHGGTVVAASEGVGRGSTFTLTLPRRPLEFIAPPTPAVPPREIRMEGALTLDEPLSLEGVNVLVVDDQEEARVVLTRALSDYGAQVTALSSGAEALALLADPPGGNWPDVLILDIAMPGEDGYAVLKKVRALEAKQRAGADQIPAIALTAFGRSEDRLRALHAGFHMHVAKPVEPAELAVIIASLTHRLAWERGMNEPLHLK
jgi:PAS domain S-box-containing protein